jgi:hypothetical protein
MASRETKRYDVDEILRRVRLDESVLFREVVAWPADVEGSRRSSREILAETTGRVVRRTIWDAPTARDLRIAVDVVECDTAREAIVALVDRLEWNQLARVPEGPPGLGVASFMHPENVPPAVFFARANLCISVVSFASRPSAVVPVAERIDRRLSASQPLAGPALGTRLKLDAEPRRRAGEPIALILSVPFPLVEDGYLRYAATGGPLEIRGGRVTLIQVAGAEARVDVAAIEPGREPTTGTLVIAPG